MERNNIVLVLDSSGSMSSCRTSVVQHFGEMCKAIVSNAKKLKQPTRVSGFSFSTIVKTLFSNVQVEDLKENIDKHYVVGGMTALWDAVGEAINNVSHKPGSKLIMVFTDGAENSSLRYNAKEITRMIREYTKTGDWTFVFNVPPGFKQSFAQLGVPLDNIKEWESSNLVSVNQSFNATTSGIGNYFSQRSLGKRSVDGFYTTDLSHLQPNKVKKELDDLSNKVHTLYVDKEDSISKFVARKLGEYRVGTAYYQLSKSEVVQENKDILIMEKNKKKVWGGPEARNLIGIPDGRIKINPGNHSNYDIFVLSTSTNRKLVRGTKLLVIK